MTESGKSEQVRIPPTGNPALTMFSVTVSRQYDCVI